MLDFKTNHNQQSYAAAQAALYRYYCRYNATMPVPPTAHPAFKSLTPQQQASVAEVHDRCMKGREADERRAAQERYKQRRLDIATQIHVHYKGNAFETCIADADGLMQANEKAEVPLYFNGVRVIFDSKFEE